MRTRLLVFAAVGLVIAVGNGMLRSDSGEKAARDNIGALIKQLGDDKFAKREQAGRELEAIGEPALTALRKAAGSSDSLEIRRRAEQIGRAIGARLAKTHTKNLQGTWQLVSMHVGDAEVAPDEIKKRRLVIDGDQWIRSIGDNAHKCPFKVNPANEPRHLDITEVSKGKSSTWPCLYELTEDLLIVCFPNGSGVRPIKIEPIQGIQGDGTYVTGVWVYKREKK